MSSSMLSRVSRHQAMKAARAVAPAAHHQARAVTKNSCPDWKMQKNSAVTRIKDAIASASAPPLAESEGASSSSDAAESAMLTPPVKTPMATNNHSWEAGPAAPQATSAAKTVRAVG